MVTFTKYVSLFLAYINSASCYFILKEGIPQLFENNFDVVLKASKVTSTKTLIPFDYSDLPFCTISTDALSAEILDHSLGGEDVTESPYELRMKHDESCKILCKKVYNMHEIQIFRNLVENEYRVHWLLDTLPVVVKDLTSSYISLGYPVGFTRGFDSWDLQHYLYNHIQFAIRYYTVSNEGSDLSNMKETYVITGVEAIPFSIHHDLSGPESKSTNSCNSTSSFQSLDSGVANGSIEVVFTYDVHWVESTLYWSHRWDIFLYNESATQIQFFSVFNSALIVLFLTTIVVIMLKKSNKHQTNVESKEASQEEGKQETSEWRLIPSDFLRPPSNPMLLSVLVGSGIQILAMSVLTLLIIIAGLFYPSNQEDLLTIMLILFAFMGPLAGYNSTRIYKLCNGKSWKLCSILTASCTPALVGAIFTSISVMLHLNGSYTAISVEELFFLWFIVSAPLVLLGSFFGFHRDVISMPIRTHHLARSVGRSVWASHPLVIVVFGGLLPFGCIFVELFFIMFDTWYDRPFYDFKFVAVIFVICMITCGETSIVFCCFHSWNADYQWWWRSFLASSSCGLYLFVYSIIWYVFKLQISGFVSSCVYFGYMIIISMLFAVMSGAVGFMSCLWFMQVYEGSSWLISNRRLFCWKLNN